MQSLEEEKEKLSAQNENLREEILKLNDELKKKAKETRLKEEQMKRSFSDQIEQLLEHTTAKDDDEIEDKMAKEKEEFRRAHLLNQDDRVHELLAEIQQVQADRDEEVRALRAELSEERQLRVQLAATAHRIKSDLDLARKSTATKQSDALALRW
ncbi:hypothetical protein OESDEN_25125 [Oesophagostomum dentatum]|uniref:Uncharacterized protein n=1 Tax=Oesophagostomum dentatum TaxID=61180 RepID=A0A0B1RRI7_OESDE|nr:hypothetical protein OESDEN_25125 [Oesophagostomum dentatum]